MSNTTSEAIDEFSDAVKQFIKESNVFHTLEESANILENALNTFALDYNILERKRKQKRIKLIKQLTLGLAYNEIVR